VAVLGGFLLDIYSARFFGFWIMVLSFAVLAIKFGIKNMFGFLPFGKKEKYAFFSGRN